MIMNFYSISTYLVLPLVAQTGRRYWGQVVWPGAFEKKCKITIKLHEQSVENVSFTYHMLLASRTAPMTLAPAKLIFFMFSNRCEKIYINKVLKNPPARQMLLTKKIQINEDFHYLTMKSAFIIYTLCSYVGIIFFYFSLSLTHSRSSEDWKNKKL